MIREKDGEIIIRPFVFHSNMEINLEGTDENELYNVMIDTIEERIQKARKYGRHWMALP